MTEYWFRPKQRGFGAGMPIHWKGWVLWAALLAAIVGAPEALRLYLGYPGNALQRVLCVAAVVIPFLYVAAKKTEGGWRWRNGDEELHEEDDGNRA